MPWKDGHPRGVFKKILITEEARKKEAESLSENLAKFQEELISGTKPPSNIVFHLTILYLLSRFGKISYLSTGKPLPPISDAIAFLDSVRFYGLPDSIRLTLYHWVRGDWDIRLVEIDPTSQEMLEAQSQGFRLASFPWGLAFSGELTEEGRDCIEHLFHDLAHAYMFFREDYDHKGQIAFFSRMKDELPRVKAQFSFDPIFQEKLRYCISDMNSHPAHLSAYWNAIQKEALERSQK